MISLGNVMPFLVVRMDHRIVIFRDFRVDNSRIATIILESI